jgi:hypothetical protein
MVTLSPFQKRQKKQVLNAAKVRNARRKLTELNEPSKPNGVASQEAVEALRTVDQ